MENGKKLKERHSDVSAFVCLCIDKSHLWYPKLMSQNCCCTMKYYKGLYGDVSVVSQESNKNTSEFLALSPCLNLGCVVNLLGHFNTIPMSFSSAIVPFYNNTLYPEAGYLLAKVSHIIRRKSAVNRLFA